MTILILTVLFLICFVVFILIQQGKHEQWVDSDQVKRYGHKIHPYGLYMNENNRLIWFNVSEIDIDMPIRDQCIAYLDWWRVLQGTSISICNMKFISICHSEWEVREKYPEEFV